MGKSRKRNKRKKQENKWGEMFSFLRGQNDESVVRQKGRQKSFTTKDINDFISDLKVIDNRKTVEQGTTQTQTERRTSIKSTENSYHQTGKKESEFTEIKTINRHTKEYSNYEKWYKLVTEINSSSISSID